jgi:hypothetical protein
MAAAVSQSPINRFLAYSHNLRWAKSHEAELARYEGRYVAIATGKVVGSAETLEEIQRKYAAKKPDAYIGYVGRSGGHRSS